MRGRDGKFCAVPVDIGQTFGKLRIVSFDHKSKNGQRYVRCVCGCGKEIVIRQSLIVTGKQTSCGCERKGAPVKQNCILIREDVAEIQLPDGRSALIDLDDVEKVSSHYWSMWGRYVFSYTGGPLHKLIFGNGVMLDHKNGNTLDNRKCNLRPCDSQQNAINRKRRSDNKTGVTGVHERYGKYIAQIRNGKIRRSKSFDNFYDAVAQRKDWERDLFGEWVRENAE